MKKIISIFASICVLLLFVSANTTPAQAASYDKAYATKTLSVKSSAGTSYKTLGKIKEGSVVNVYGAVAVGKDQDDWYGYQQYGWSKIKYNNKTGWVKTHELHFADPYKWTPGVKDEVIKSLKKYYLSKNDKMKLVKADYFSNEGRYVCYVQFGGKGKWYPFVTINIKTGWYHG
ncbi:SH3 domain-containing protein [Peribacillus sp. Hz7]|uniref:SH3 domain-containing protein n=1 Tax=Peribacillus sp. Hz7 TaxID=3344873 RepID=UPI0035CC8D71